MDGRCHVGVNQTNQLEIASHGKNYGIDLPIFTCQKPAVDTRGVVIDREIGCSTVRRRTTCASCEADWAHLQRWQESDGVDIVGGKRPGKALACLTPDLEWQVGTRL